MEDRSGLGAAVAGSLMSGGYAGAKRMLWIMASYANGVAAELDLGIRFQALVLQQMTAAGGVGRAGIGFVYSNPTTMFAGRRCALGSTHGRLNLSPHERSRVPSESKSTPEPKP